ncbi:Anti-anti-sigma regulatory factor (antagonist of anti-sigma factor) [Streptomyces sp. DvalAA-14]|uniref:STAS domain-containing protein n=1 Tax=unclassified Streptomyces TaxID=2593676 RepID=UPI00081B58F6|nr:MULTISPECIES: STAS domain-containing protein [unclassified Streptomyces]MYS19033.1 STAS domain-containing protein [Streptomyces sp. SID4948]SCD34660.1 Anti-anti-sigma regulatory factor (antagonist of anti-sigma factor) [Streptomyces sp. DvalAA-14]
MLVLRGNLDHRVEQRIAEAAEQARRSGVSLVVDASEVTYLNVDVLALFLDAHTDPGVSFTPPLPEALVRLMEMTGTRSVFPLHRPPLDPPPTDT